MTPEQRAKVKKVLEQHQEFKTRALALIAKNQKIIATHFPRGK